MFLYSYIGTLIIIIDWLKNAINVSFELKGEKKVWNESSK